MTLIHLRILTDNQWSGGGGYTPREVAEMTPDQAYFRLADPKVLRAKSKVGTRQAGVPASVAAVGDGSGKAVARTESGERIELRKGGESLARRLAKEQAGKPATKYRVEGGEIVFEEPEQKRRRRKRKRGGGGN